MRAHRALVSAFVVLFVAGYLSAPADVAAATNTTFSGQATVIKGKVAGMSVGPIVDTGPVSPSGGNLEASLLEYPVAGLPDPTGGALRAEVLHATVVAHGNKSSAEAVVARFSLDAAGQTIGAEVLAARASASCAGGTASISGSSEVVGLTLNGQKIAVTGGTNQEILIPTLGRIVINEQIFSVSADRGDITVNALHIELTDPVLGTKTDLVVASAHADIACGGQGLCPNKDFVTGGGWITTSTGGRANLAVAGGPDGWGHLQYIDHGNGLKVKGTGVTAYVPTGPNSRHIEGTASINGQPGTYQADVTDVAEPGRNDVFALKLSTGYMQQATLSGGNLQLHCK